MCPWYDSHMSWDPIRDFRAWQERLERLSSHHPDTWAPAIDVYETADQYVITAEVPGIEREQVELALEDSRLTIRGQRAERSPDGNEVIHFHQVERGYGPFARTFDFAEKIAIDRVSADLRDGVLTITLPKRPPPPARKIQVK
jgi:HSP20 family protein